MRVKSCVGLLFSMRGSMQQKGMKRPGNCAHAASASSLDCTKCSASGEASGRITMRSIPSRSMMPTSSAGVGAVSPLGRRKPRWGTVWPWMSMTGDILDPTELVDHAVDGLLQLLRLALGFHGDLGEKTAVGQGGGHLGDVAPLVGEVSRHEVDAVGQLLPGAGDARHFRLT